jgi:chromosome segregation ATPase
LGSRLLSGGEKTMAGLALYFSANIVKGVSFMIFDESDAYLDHENTMKFIHFI